MTEVWVANDQGTEIVRARDIAVASLDYDGNVTVRLADADGAVVTVVALRAHHEERRPDDFHRQLIRVIAELSDAAGTFLVRAVHDEARGWQWVTEPL
jgi:endonuclease/exonuclease/phosphatase (EEP) superfamily protein YafD